MTASRLAAMIFSALLASCDYPRDSAETYENVRGGTLRVGVSERPPWVVKRHGAPAGVEPRLIEDFAETLEAKVAWTWGTESGLATALKERQLDVMIGGHSRSSPWAGELAATEPYIEVSIVIAAAKNSDARNQDGAIRYPADRPAFAAFIAQDGRHPLPTEAPGDGPIAVYDFEARALGLVPTGARLADLSMVMLVAPGESRFLYELDRFLASRSRSEMIAQVPMP